MKTYQSAHQHGDEVVLNFFDAGTISNAKITEVAFKPNKVLYDAEIEVKEGMKTRIHGIDSSFVSKKTILDPKVNVHYQPTLVSINGKWENQNPIENHLFYSIDDIEKVLDHERISHGSNPLDSINRIYKRLLSLKDKKQIEQYQNLLSINNLNFDQTILDFLNIKTISLIAEASFGPKLYIKYFDDTEKIYDITQDDLKNKELLKKSILNDAFLKLSQKESFNVPTLRSLKDTVYIEQLFGNIVPDYDVLVTNLPALSFYEETNLPTFIPHFNKKDLNIKHFLAQTMFKKHFLEFIKNNSISSIIFVANNIEDLNAEKIRFYYFEKSEIFIYTVKTNEKHFFILNQTYDVKTVNRTMPQEIVAKFKYVDVDNNENKLTFTSDKIIENGLYHIGEHKNCLVTKLH